MNSLNSEEKNVALNSRYLVIFAIAVISYVVKIYYNLIWDGNGSVFTQCETVSSIYIYVYICNIYYNILL